MKKKPIKLKGCFVYEQQQFWLLLTALFSKLEMAHWTNAVQ
jgi:hypothetical protein